MPGAKPYGQLQYKEINGKRMAYIDEGHGDAIVFQHGNPTSSYLWRNVMPHLEGLGRLVACDLIGMGGSDKLDDSGPDRYHYAEQRDYLFQLWDELDLGDRVIFVLHDWGSALGFDWANRHRDRLAGIAYMEAVTMPIDWSDFPGPMRTRLPGLPLARRRVNGVGPEHVRRGGVAQHPSSASSPMRRWTTTARRSAIPARIAGRHCRGHATSRSRASPPTSSPPSRSTAPGCPKAMCPNCSSKASRAHSSAVALSISSAPGPTRPKSACPVCISFKKTVPTKSARP